MIKNITTTYKNYLDSMKGLYEGHAEAVNDLYATFSEKLAESKLIDLNTAFDSAIANYKEECKNQAKNTLKSARSELKTAAGKPIPNDIANVLKTFEGLNLSDAEKDMILEMTKNSYLARRRAADLLGVENQKIGEDTYDSLIAELDELEKIIDHSIIYDGDNFNTYTVRCLAHDSFLNDLDKRLTDFCETYGK